MKEESAIAVLTAMKSAGVDFVSFLPESRLNQMIPLLDADPDITVVRASHEGSAVSIASGAALAGKVAAVYMEATGLILSLYQLHGVAIRRGVPLLLLVSYVGSPGDKANSMTFSGWGRRVEPLLHAMGIEYRIVEDDAAIGRDVEDMVRAARSSQMPAALLLTGEFTAFTGGWT